MKKITFIIDDFEWIRQYYKLTDEQYNIFVEDRNAFKCIYTLYGEGNNPDRYDLTDFAGNRICINDLNDFQRVCILGDCIGYFMGRRTFGEKFGENRSVPFGVLEIKEDDYAKSF